MFDNGSGVFNGVCFGFGFGLGLFGNGLDLVEVIGKDGSVWDVFGGFG